MRKQVGT